MKSKQRQAAKLLFESHERRERFAPLPADLAPRTPEEAYAIQDAFVALRSDKLGAIVGYKIALTSAEMRRLVGIDKPQAGAILEATIQRTPARLRAADYVRLIVEFEIAVEMAEDLPAADAPFSHERVARSVGAVMAALEIADDRNADYAELAKHPFELIADNAWNEGAVLGDRMQEWRKLALSGARAVARINGAQVGEGRCRDAMGHPFAAVAWIADHLAAHGRGLLRGDIVLTGSIIASQYPKPGDLISFSVEGLGEVELRVD
jgi:2-keto-4-pentenoate hydratase